MPTDPQILDVRGIKERNFGGIKEQKTYAFLICYSRTSQITAVSSFLGLELDSIVFGNQEKTSYGDG